MLFLRICQRLQLPLQKPRSALFSEITGIFVLLVYKQNTLHCVFSPLYNIVNACVISEKKNKRPCRIDGAPLLLFFHQKFLEIISCLLHCLDAVAGNFMVYNN